MSIIKRLNFEAIDIITVVQNDNEQQHLNNRVQNAVEFALID